MFETPDPAWPVMALAAVLAVDALLSVKPVEFIRECLVCVNFPVEWGWALVWIKLVAVAGLLVGLNAPGVGVAATAGVIAYFLAAAAAHIRARALGVTFWVNCLGMLAFAVGVLLISFVL
ncbi:DoxX family protein [Mycolicibacterium brumae]|uniref:DoxX family protein n=1 Tax=Mycolicibacterium brumae TaxID=85968 RepID=A0A2G5PGQ9_9MYCO|nr:DoxX family protein [Mycolicibacterium brumae]MCV7194396.1 hypothetical protein [Mycolicibacterium brumae]PIB77213.1 hypothetical protein CQY22_002910 [Mycolicibacterium brumae]RWA15453.1 hypothetical protein MBRU_10410 [Mycolicibacterium brumae DSM 44177]UWW10566.1 hypothetical protein L2Z93_003699 [Mycolicibacterium brumae]